MKKTIEGSFVNYVVNMETKEYRQIGFEDDAKSFGDLMASLVPKIGSKKKARLTIELLNEKNEKK